MLRSPRRATVSSKLFAEMLKKPPEDIKQPLLNLEQIKVGVHAQAITTSLSKKRTRAILRTLNTAGLEGYLKKYPLASIVFGVPEDLSFMAHYDSKTHELMLNAARATNTYGEVFIPGITSTISSAGLNLDEAISRSLLHEMAHHIFHSSFFATNIESEIRTTFRQAHFITRRAAYDWQEWFSECFTAFHFENPALKTFDPAGYDTIKRIRKELGLP